MKNKFIIPLVCLALISGCNQAGHESKNSTQTTMSTQTQQTSTTIRETTNSTSTPRASETTKETTAQETSKETTQVATAQDSQLFMGVGDINLMNRHLEPTMKEETPEPTTVKSKEVKTTTEETTQKVKEKLSNEEVKNLVLNGAYSNGIERRKKLEAEGYDYEEIQALIDKECVSKAPVSTAQYSLDEFMFIGRLSWEGKVFTYYSQRVLPGPGLNIPGRHVNGAGYVSDGDGYIVLASDALPKGTVVSTPFGYDGKVYDAFGTGQPAYRFDVYTR